jgi:hypothetical protein
MEISFKGALSEDEYKKVNKLHYPYKKLEPLLKILVPLMIIVVIFNFSKERNASIFLLFLIAFWVYISILRRYRIRKYWNECKAIKEQSSGVVNEKGITIKNETSTSNKTWGHFTKYKLSSEMVLLYQSYAMTNAFPRSFFENDSDWDAFVQIVKDKVPSK